jgi:hypothetical protein
MSKATAAKLKAEQRARRIEQGYVQKTVWVHKDDLWHFGVMMKRLGKTVRYRRHKS